MLRFLVIFSEIGQILGNTHGKLSVRKESIPKIIEFSELSYRGLSNRCWSFDYDIFSKYFMVKTIYILESI